MRLFKRTALMAVLTLFTVMMSSWMTLSLPEIVDKPYNDCILQIGDWQRVARSPVNHLEGAAAVVKDKLYLLGGYTEAGPPLVPTNRVDVYNPATNIWESMVTPRRPVPFSGSHMQAAVFGNKIFIAGGFIGNNPGPLTNQVWRYNTKKDRWKRMPDLPAMRASGGLVIIGRNLHYIGGLRNRRKDTGTHLVLDLDNPVRWHTLEPLPRPRNHFQALNIGGLIYVAGGQTGHDQNPIDVDYLDIYDPATDTWTTGANLDYSRSHFEPGTLRIGGRLIAAGGRSSTPPRGQLSSLAQYDPELDRWDELKTLPTALYNPTAGYINGKIIITAGGYDFTRLQRASWIADVTIPDCLKPTSEPTEEPTATSEPTPETFRD